MFWTRNQGLEDEDQITCAQEENFIGQIEKSNDYFRNQEITRPTYFSQNNGWKPQPLMKIADFCYTIDKEKTDCFAFLKETGKLSQELEGLEDMNEE